MTYSKQKVAHLLKCDLERFINSIIPMTANECEECIRLILNRIHGPRLEQILAEIPEIIIPAKTSKSYNYEDLYHKIRKLFPIIYPDNTMLTRLSVLVLRMIELRFVGGTHDLLRMK